MDHSLVLLSETKPCRVGPPKMGGSWWRGLTECGHSPSTGEGNGKPLQYSCLENPMNSMKRQNDRILKEELPRLVGAQMLLEISGEITPERIKGWSLSKNNTQLWM